MTTIGSIAGAIGAAATNATSSKPEPDSKPDDRLEGAAADAAAGADQLDKKSGPSVKDDIAGALEDIFGPPTSEQPNESGKSGKIDTPEPTDESRRAKLDGAHEALRESSVGDALVEAGKQNGTTIEIEPAQTPPASYGAYFDGKSNKVVVPANIVDRYSPEQLSVLLAHELSHAADHTAEDEIGDRPGIEVSLWTESRATVVESIVADQLGVEGHGPEGRDGPHDDRSAAEEVWAYKHSIGEVDSAEVGYPDDWDALIRQGSPLVTKAIEGAGGFATPPPAPDEGPSIHVGIPGVAGAEVSLPWPF